MKKQIIISTFIGALIWGTTALLVLNTANAKEPNTNEKLLANNSSLIATKTPLNTKNETVYVTTDENGNSKSKFIGSILYSGTEELPFNFKITYFLNNQEISANDLKGKSGHVKIVFNYDSTVRYQGKYVPFLAITNLILDHAKFTNLKLDNGKLLHETPDNYIVTGFALAGANADLSIDFMPDSFTFEADVTDFKLEDVYTVFTNDLIADIDLSMLTDLDSVVNSIYQLSDGLNRIISGANELTNGLSTALDGTKTLYEGSKTLAAGAKDANDGATKLSKGLTTLTENNEKLQTGANSIIESTLANLQEKFPGIDVDNYTTILETTIKNLTDYLKTLTPGTTDYQETYEKIVNLSNAKGMLDFGVGVIAYTNGTATAATGATELSAGLTKISTGANTLSEGLGSLVEGQTKLYQGAITLRDGLTTFKTSGIDKLVNFATKDLARFTNNLRATVRAAASYKSFGDVDSKSVKFIVKTPAI